MFDPVPWFVGGGAQHSPETARNAIHIASSGAEGVTSPTGLRVAALATPGTSIRVLPGSALILNRSAGGAEQTYTVRAGTETVVPVAAQGASGVRYDLVIARVEDPFMAGTPWADPTDPKVGPYVFPRIVSNVTAGTTRVQDVPGYANDSAITLARIAIPANTGTITQAMVTDLRSVARPKRTRDLYVTSPTSTSAVTTSSTVDWTPQANRNIVVPAWASQVKIIGTVAGARASAPTTGGVAALFGSMSLQGVLFEFEGAGRQALAFADTLAIPASMRGTTQALKLRGNRSAGTLSTDTYSTIIWDIEFLEIASAD